MYQLSNIQITRNERLILDIPSLSIPTSEFTVVLGHNGSGKSTLVNLLSGQLLPDKGEITLNKSALSQFKARPLAKQIAYLPQKLPSGISKKKVINFFRLFWRFRWICFHFCLRFFPARKARRFSQNVIKLMDAELTFQSFF